MDDKRLLGCIPAAIQAAKARDAGRISDIDQVAMLAAPWDKTEQPSIIQWGDRWREHLTDHFLP